MGTAARVAGGLVFVLFVGVIAIRPLAANPAISGTVRDGLGRWQLLAVLPLLLVTVLVVALRVRSLAGNGPEESDETRSVADAENRGTFWDARKAGDTQADAGRLDRTERSAEPAESGDGEPVLSAESQSARESGGGPTEQSDLLGGQGGTRDREFDIEEKPPDARLSEHLDHLRAELDGEAETAQDLRTLERVTEEVAADRTVPKRCPQTHCDAVWTGRTVLGIGTDRYELLDNGKRVQCLECEEIQTLERDSTTDGHTSK